jgi:DUF2934 family protein
MSQRGDSCTWRKMSWPRCSRPSEFNFDSGKGELGYEVGDRTPSGGVGTRQRGNEVTIMEEVVEIPRLGGIHYRADIGCSVRCVSDLIRKRAYEFFEARGRNSGHELDDWLQAEQETRHHLGL